MASFGHFRLTYRLRGAIVRRHIDFTAAENSDCSARWRLMIAPKKGRVVLNRLDENARPAGNDEAILDVREH